MSVAIGIAHPPAPDVPALKAVYTRAGTIIPPSAAATGSVTARRSRSSPVTISRLISRPTTKKNTAIRPSSTRARQSSCSPATSNGSSRCQNEAQPSRHGELASTRLTTVAISSTMPPADSTWTNRTIGATVRRTTLMGIGILLGDGRDARRPDFPALRCRSLAAGSRRRRTAGDAQPPRIGGTVTGATSPSAAPSPAARVTGAHRHRRHSPAPSPAAPSPAAPSPAAPSPAAPSPAAPSPSRRHRHRRHRHRRHRHRRHRHRTFGTVTGGTDTVTFGTVTGGTDTVTFGTVTGGTRQSGDCGRRTRGRRRGCPRRRRGGRRRRAGQRRRRMRVRSRSDVSLRSLPARWEQALPQRCARRSGRLSSGADITSANGNRLDHSGAANGSTSRRPARSRRRPVPTPHPPTGTGSPTAGPPTARSPRCSPERPRRRAVPTPRPPTGTGSTTTGAANGSITSATGAVTSLDHRDDRARRRRRPPRRPARSRLRAPRRAARSRCRPPGYS